jgi:hypothetical protein
MAFSPAIRNWQSQPPNGGWAIEFILKDKDGHPHKWYFKGLPNAIVEAISDVQKANDIFDGYGPVWDHCNAIWTKRDPKRATSYSTISGTKINSTTSKAFIKPQSRTAHRARVSKPCGRC